MAKMLPARHHKITLFDSFSTGQRQALKWGDLPEGDIIDQSFFPGFPERKFLMRACIFSPSSWWPNQSLSLVSDSSLNHNVPDWHHISVLKKKGYKMPANGGYAKIQTEDHPTLFIEETCPFFGF
jgi:hypothetical protein